MGILLSTPMDILGDAGGERWDALDFVRSLGIPQLGYILTAFGVIAAIIVIIIALIKLLIVNNPRQVSMTKTKFVHGVLVVIVLASLTILLDAVMTVVFTTIMGKP